MAIKLRHLYLTITHYDYLSIIIIIILPLSSSQMTQGLAASTIVLTGGNANIPFFKQRLQQELRPMVPDIYPVQVDMHCVRTLYSTYTQQSTYVHTLYSTYTIQYVLNIEHNTIS